MKNIGILLASNGENKKLAIKIQQEIQLQKSTAKIIHLNQLKLPLYLSDKEYEAAQEINFLTKKLITELNTFDAYFIVAPEYNGGIPPVLSNTLCWLSVSGGEDWRELFKEKFAAIATHSGGNGNHLLKALSFQLEHLGMNVIGRKILTTYQQSLNEESLSSVTKQLLSVCKLN